MVSCMRSRRFLFIALGALLTLASCNDSRKDKRILNSIDLSVEVLRFDQDLFSINTDSMDIEIAELEQKYTPFFTLFTEGVIGIGQPGDEDFDKYLISFIDDGMVSETYGRVLEIFPNTKQLNFELTNAFKRFKYYFPQRNIPKVYGFVSGFNNSIILADSILGVGFDRYLGRDCEYYPLLGIHKYLAYNMHPQKISSDLIHSLALGEFPYNDTIDNLLSRMVYEGSQIYFTKALLPQQPDSLIIGFTPDQMKWCKRNEKDMWEYLVEHRLLFGSDAFMISQYIKDAPFTTSFTKDSPGRAAVWLGYRIVSDFMRRNPDYTLQMLMEDDDYMGIMNRANYKP